MSKTMAARRRFIRTASLENVNLFKAFDVKETSIAMQKQPIHFTESPENKKYRILMGLL